MSTHSTCTSSLVASFVWFCEVITHIHGTLYGRGYEPPSKLF
jgi:hypothetical protein